MNVKKISVLIIFLALLLFGAMAIAQTDANPTTYITASNTRITDKVTATNIAPSPMPPRDVECKTYVDNHRCKVKVCSDGKEERYCHSIRQSKGFKQV